MWLTQRERLILAVSGSVALLALGILVWQRQRPPLTVERSPVTAEEAPRWDEALAKARRIDVNTADAAAWERLPGIGPSLARRIVDYRSAHGRFVAVEELSQVPGIGPRTLDALREYLTLE